MWSIGELKQRGKLAMKANYWLTVLVALVLNASVGSSVSTSWRSASFQTGPEEELGNLSDIIQNHPGIALAVAAAVSGTLLVIKLIDFLVFNPIECGCRNYFIRNSFRCGKLDDLKEAFHAWSNKALTMFLRDLFVFLWSLLLIIPGIVKSYSYMMVPYILAENPDMSGTEAITLSRRMMDGEKWNAFMLDLSFVGWGLLGLLTCGILLVLYVNPYHACTQAELYNVLKQKYAWKQNQNWGQNGGWN